MAMRMINRLDHIVFGCLELMPGNEQIESLLNTRIPPGGKHPLMGTHNCVASTAAEEFLEVIAIDPEAPPIQRKRWFSLDDPATHELLRHGPKPLCWVVNTTDLDAVVKHSPVELGEIVEVTRGHLTWQLSVPADGHLPLDRLLPTFIQWPDAHPARQMQSTGVTIASIDLQHPEPDTVNAVFKRLAIDHLATVSEGPKPSLGFSLKTPDGSVVTLT